MATTAPGFPTRHFAIAVSGGGDSLGMLALAIDADRETCLTVLTVDHALRSGSADDAAYVASLCDARDIPCEILTLNWPDGVPTSDIQARARAARYDAMAAACRARGIDAFCTAHHADDQAETLLMRLVRGAGLSGLAGIRETTIWHEGQGDAGVTLPPQQKRETRVTRVTRVTLHRPCLHMRRAELHAAAQAHDFVPRDDPANSDPRHDRTHARRWLAEHPDFDAARLTASAGHLAQADAALVWAADLAFTSRVQEAEGETVLAFDHAGLPAEIVRRVVFAILSRLAPKAPAPNGLSLVNFIACLSAGKTTTLSGIIAIPGPHWRFRREEDRTPRL